MQTDYKNRILKLSESPEYLHINGKHKGKPYQKKIAKTINCSVSTVRYYLNTHSREYWIKSQKNQTERKTTVGYIYDKNRHLKNSDPESIFRADSLLKICNDEMVDQKIKEMQY